MPRVLEYFRGMSIKGGQLHVDYTGAIIPFDKPFRKSAYSVVRIYSYFKWRQLTRLFKKPDRDMTIAFHPLTPGPWYNIWQVANLADLRFSDDIRNADVAFIFEDSTHSIEPIPELDCTDAQLINERIHDISKERVGDVFENVFGYSLRVDPTKYQGLAVQKSNANGTHDGVVIECPIDPQDVVPGQAYQRLVDSTFNGKTSEDLRIAWVLGEIALVYHKHKPLDDRFGTHYLSTDVMAANEVFSDEEISNIGRFCQNMGLDFGAIDVMRDKNDGRIYIVDVNKTCMPVLSLSLKTQIASQQKIADALVRGLARA